MRPLPLLSLLAASAFAACGDLAVKSVRPPSSVPTTLLGEWQGLWQSSRGSATGNGEVIVRVQAFEGQPILSLGIDNPCLEPRDYELLATGTTFELRADGQTVFAAVLAAERVLTGTFACEADGGVWQASWQRELPVVSDLRGAWVGTVSSSSAPATTLLLDLDQVVRGGRLMLEGSLALPELLPGTMPVSGSVRFREGSFDLVLGTPFGVDPSLQLAGIGASETLVVENGILQAGGDPRLPFASAVWRVEFDRR